jgi:hypothetical protein
LGVVDDEKEGALSSSKIYNAEAIAGQVEPQHVRRLLLDIGKKCPRSEIKE